MFRKHICALLSAALLISGVSWDGLCGTEARAAETEASATEPAPSTAEPEPSAAVTELPSDGQGNKAQGLLRLIFTTDIHGQVTDYDYQTGKNLERGLNKAFTMIKAARGEVPESNSMTFDIGDSVMDFNTDYIYAQDPEALQPVYTAMGKIGYDAITLGNHDFDFGYDYASSQLETSGLMDLCVLSNVYSKINGASVFGAENKIIEKEIKADDGSKIAVKVGIIGETTPSLSTRTEPYKDKLVTEDIIENAQKQAKALKEGGADIIVALAHSGFGTETPSQKSANAAYALTKIEDIDVVLAGHEHIDFPTGSKSDVHYGLSGVDKETGLVNGKRLVMIRDSCRGIGVVDLKLGLDNEKKIVIKDAPYEIRKTTKETEGNSEIEEAMSPWDDALKQYCQKEVGVIKEGERWSNYKALLDGNEIIQTVHNAQIAYASSYIASNAEEYKGYPIISIARYTKYGSDSGADYADLSGTIAEGSADSFANYHRYVYIYKITGAQLREWLEWSASIYQTANTSAGVNWNNILLSDFIKKERGNSLVQEDFIYEWNRFFQFDGIEYTVSLNEKPRYDYDGNKINDSFRVKSITRNGVAVSDEDNFILVTDKITPGIQSEANSGVASQIISRSHVILQDIVKDYLAKKNLLGGLEVCVNHNWKLEIPDGYKYMIVSGKGSEDEFLSEEWCQGIYGSIAESNFYKCVNKNEKEEKDVCAPGVVLSPDNTSETNGSVNIAVIANDKSGIKEEKFAYGSFEKEDEAWAAAASIEGGVFVADKNGVYSVYVKDGADNVSVEKIAVTNIYPEILLTPTVKKVDNNDSKVTGIADPNLKIYVQSGSSIYEGRVGVDGAFSVKVPPQKAKVKLYVFVEDDNGRQSKKTAVVVKRVGPNCPTVTSAKNNQRKIEGRLNDSKVNVYAVIGDSVYISKQLGPSYYTKCKKYDKELAIKKVGISVKDGGSYVISIPNQYAGTAIKVFTVDELGRVSHARNKKITKAAPNRVTLYEISDIERYAYGYVPDSGGCTVALVDGSKKYEAVTNDEGYFKASIRNISAGSAVTAYAYKKSSGKIKKSYVKTYVVESAAELYTQRRDVKIHIDEVTDKDMTVSGKWTEPDSKIYICAGGSEYVATTDEDGYYDVDLRARLRIGTPVYVMSRSVKGGIKGMRKFNVTLGAPLAPMVVGRVDAASRYVMVYTREKCAVTLKVGKKTYSRSENAYVKRGARYYYTFKIERARAGAKIRAYAKNSAGRTASRAKKIQKVKKAKKSKKAKRSASRRR